MSKHKHDSLGDIAIRLGELTFGGVVLGSILATDVNKVLLFVGGISAFAVLITIGMILNSKDKEK